MSITFLYTGDSYPAWLTCAVGFALVLITGILVFHFGDKINDPNREPAKPQAVDQAVEFPTIYGGAP